MTHELAEERADLRQPARPGRAGDAGARLAHGAAVPARLEHERDDGRDRVPEPEPGADAVAARADAQSLDGDVRRPALDARRARSARRRSRFRPSGASTEFADRPAPADEPVDPDGRSAERADPQPVRRRRSDHPAAGDPGARADRGGSRSRVRSRSFNDSQPQVDYFREYTPDVVAALTNLGQIGGYFDANGHYARTQPFFGAFGLNGANELDARPDSLRFQGLSTARTGARVAPSSRRRTGHRRVPCPGLHQVDTPPGSMRRIAPSSPRSSRSPSITAVASSSSRGSGSPYQVRAIFDDAAFAVPGEDVRIAGAIVGSIKSLDVCTKAPCPIGSPLNKAAVTIQINNADFTPFYADAHCAIRPQSLIGEKYVDCTPGSSSSPALAEDQQRSGLRAPICCRSLARAPRSTPTSSRTSLRRRSGSGSR